MKTIPEYKRTGKCTHCGVCCLFGGRMTVSYGRGSNKFHKTVGWTELKKNKDGSKTYGRIQGCPQLIIKKGKFLCKLHGKKSQPKECTVFPEEPDDEFYQAIKDFCGYKFKKVKK